MSRPTPARISHRRTAASRYPDASVRAGRRRFLHVLAGALLAPAVVDGAHAQPSLGRLFSTPEQRLGLDRLRHDGDLADQALPVAADTLPAPPLDSPLDAPSVTEEAPAVRTVSIDGIAIRADGRGVAWINGVEAALGTTTPDGVRVGAPLAGEGRVRIRFPGVRRGVYLEPGQTIDVGSGRVLDTWERPWAPRRAAVSGAGGAGQAPDTEPSAGAADPAREDALR